MTSGGGTAQVATGAGSQRANVDVFLILRDGRGRVLFGLRAAHLYAGGQWNLPSGKADEGEDVITAVIREAHEEVGLTLRPYDVIPLGVVHVLTSGGQPRVGFAFTAQHDPARQGEAVNGEPDKCDRLLWTDPVEAPEPLEAYNAAVLALASGGQAFVVHGW